uniref:Uncharacterized protein n=1 Tax=Globisporangium ultimum (strain ATCC 200006 / CBS 805.95 / DAOM BR144) TaxID=431595 RepID=K3XBR6_GLOUD
MYSNFDDLQQQWTREQQTQHHDLSSSSNRFLFYFEHGQHWFHALAEQQHAIESLKFTTAALKAECQRLREQLLHAQEQDLQLHKTNSSNNPNKGSGPWNPVGLKPPSPVAPPQFPQLRNLLYVGNMGKLDFQASDYDFWPCCEEILLVFQSLPPQDALRMLTTLLEKASGMTLPELGETYAIAVDLLDEKERRTFLREYLQFISSQELQDALIERDECNDEKRWQMLVDELKDRLGLAPEGEDKNEDGDDPIGSAACGKVEGDRASKRLTRFHSNEAKIGAKVHEIMELLEDLAAEVSLLEDDHGLSGVLSQDLRKKLRAYENPVKRVEKAHELMMRANLGNHHFHNSMPVAPASCDCHCGKHQPVHEDDEKEDAPWEVLTVDRDSDNDSKKRKTSRKSFSRRPGSAKRKNAVNLGSRLSTRNSTTGLKIFPLSEACHLLSAILHLQFARDVTAEATSGSSRMRENAMNDDRWNFLRHTTTTASNQRVVPFKTLAKDYLVRRYGIKSIAAMHTLQLERSLVNYAAIDKHTRCELFAWFFGADKLRRPSKDFAFAFFQRFIKIVIRLFTTKKPHVVGPPLSFATMISVWTEYIGDGETLASLNNGDLVRYLAPTHAVDACNLAFPMKMKETSEYTAFLERFYRLGLDRDQVELESFLKNTMELWYSVFERMRLEILSHFDALDAETEGGAGTEKTVNFYDFDAFSRCLVRNGLELTGGERLELFDLLSLDFANDENEDGDNESGSDSVVTKKKLLHFILEAKYLRIATT